MPFSSLSDPADVARSQAALERVWSEVQIAPGALANPVAERERLAFIVANLATLAVDEDDLAARALARYLATGLSDLPR